MVACRSPTEVHSCFLPSAMAQQTIPSWQWRLDTCFDLGMLLLGHISAQQAMKHCLDVSETGAYARRSSKLVPLNDLGP